MSPRPTPYDRLGIREQAMTRAEWDEQVKTLRKGLDLEAEFRAEGANWVEADAAGRVHVRP